MSKTRYKWWGYVKAIIRAYPEHKADLQAVREQSIVPAYGAVGGGEARRTVEDAALRELPYEEMKEYSAVERAIQDTLRYTTGAERMRLVDMVFFRCTHTLHGAAMKLNVSYYTAVRWHNAFIRQTAENFGLARFSNGNNTRSEKEGNEGKEGESQP